jgi:hypothetical protein
MDYFHRRIKMACVEFANLCYIAGDTINIDFQYLEDDGTTPIDLTGATAKMQLLDSFTSLTAVEDMNGGITEPLLGSGRFSLTAAESQALLPIIDAIPNVSFVSHIRFTFVDLTIKTVAGADLVFNQTGIR